MQGKAVKSILLRKASGSDDFIEKFYQTLPTCPMAGQKKKKKNGMLTYHPHDLPKKSTP